MERQWYQVKPIQDLSILSELKDDCQLKLSESFQKFIMTHNAGKTKPSPYIWLSKYNRGYMFYEVLDFSQANKYAYKLVYDMHRGKENLSQDFYIPFAITKDEKGIFMINNGAVYVHDVETDNDILIFSSFDSFQRKYLNNIISTND